MSMFLLLILNMCIAELACLRCPPRRGYDREPGHKVHQRRKIIGGREAEIKEFPYQTLICVIYTEEMLLCAGSILDETTILTAAHCIINPKYGKYKSSFIRVGTRNRFAGGQMINVTRAIPHPRFSPYVMNYDIAILKLEKKIQFGKNVQPIPVSHGLPQLGTMVSIAGWGARKQGGATTKNLFAVEIPIVNRNICRQIYKDSSFLVANHAFCAGFLNGGNDTCQGDSGGPVVYNGTQIGIVSWGEGCGQEGKAGVYTDVSKFEDFIKEFSSE